MALTFTQLRAQLGATTLFLQELMRCPQQIGAILPSSKSLAKTMARWIPLDLGAVVVELGPGTGVVTQAMFERGLPQEQLVAIEKSAPLAELLRGKFPKATIVMGDAWELDKLLIEHAHQVDRVGAVVSSLPLRNFSRARTLVLARKISSVLAAGGRWIQFSYHLRSLHPAADGLFTLAAWEVVWWNVPPARVNVYQKVSVAHKAW